MGRVVSLLIGYIFGLFQTGVLVGKKEHVDIRHEGSGSSGATNALRTMGIKAGLITFIGDIVKTVLAFFLARLLFGRSNADMSLLYGLYAAAGVILGHNFPFYLKFHGGKGVACLCGLAFALGLKMVPIPCLLFVLVVWRFRYVSVGSLVGVTALTIEFLVFGNLGILRIGEAYHAEAYLLMIFLALLRFFSIEPISKDL